VRLTFIMLALVVASALSLVSAQHKARRLVAQFEQERNQEKQLNVEYGQLQLEVGTWAMHSRVERIATERLHMRPQDPRRTALIGVPAGEAVASK